MILPACLAAAIAAANPFLPAPVHLAQEPHKDAPRDSHRWPAAKAGAQDAMRRALAPVAAPAPAIIHRRRHGRRGALAIDLGPMPAGPALDIAGARWVLIRQGGRWVAYPAAPPAP